jgi:uncharacterized protein (TIGR03067 family)
MTFRLLAAALLVFGLGHLPESTDNDADTLQGKWLIVSSEYEGQDTTRVYRSGTALVFKGNESYFTDGFAQSMKTKFKLDQSAKPKAIDLGEDDKKMTLGIYAIEKDSLQLCLNSSGKRPSEFKTAKGDKTNLFTLKRQK